MSPAGRPPIKLPEDWGEQVEKLAQVLNQEQIARYFGISVDTLQRRMKEDPEARAAYDKGKSGAIEEVGMALLAKALKGDTTSMIFYLKTQAGWRETKRIETVEVSALEEKLRGLTEPPDDED